MRTKRKNYKYDSSDFENGDYDQEDFEGEEDDFEDEDQVEESVEESDFNDSNNLDGRKNPNVKSKVPKIKNEKEQEDDIEDTYEDEDPFSPEIDQILADKQIEMAQVQVSQQQNALMQKSTRGMPALQQMKNQNWFLVKFSDQSYLHVKWIEESKLEEYSYRAKQKIRRYWNAKEKKRFIQEQIQRQAIVFKPKENHHFSDDEEEEEEDEDAAIKGIQLPILPIITEDIVDEQANRPTHIPVEGPAGEDMTQYFDKNYVAIDRILSTTLLFPVIHPRQAKQIRGKWQEDCMKVVNVLANFRKNNVPIGLVFCDQLDTEKSYQQTTDFWNDLGLLFKNCRIYYKSQKRGLRKQCDALRCIAYHLYNDWYQEQKNRFITGIALPSTQPENIQKQNDYIQRSNSNLNKEEKDSTIIVNLQSLLKTQMGTNDQQKKQILPEQQTQMAPNFQQLQPNLQNQQQMPPPLSMTPNSLQQQQINEMSQNRQQSIQQQPQQNFGFQQMQNQQPMQSMQQPPSLPSLNQLMNPMNQINPMAFPTNNFQDQSQMLQQMQNPQQQNMNPGFMGQGTQQIKQNNQLINPQQQQQQDYMQNQQLDWMQQSKQNYLQLFTGQIQQQMDQNASLSLPMMGQMQQNMMQSSFANPQQQQKQPQMLNDPLQMMDLNQLQALQNQQDKNINYFNQMMGVPNQSNMNQPDMMQLMAQQVQQEQLALALRQGFNTPGQLPSLNQLQGYNQPQNQLGTGFQLPSLSQMGQLNPQIGNFDPFSSNFMGMMPNPGMINPMMPQQNINMLKLPQFQSTINSSNAYDEMSMMLGNFQHTLPGIQPGFNPFGQPDMPSNQQFYGYGGQLPSMQQNPIGNQFGMRNNPSPLQMMPNIQNNQPQLTRVVDPNLVQPDNLDQYNDKQQDPPVPPCIMDPGAYDLSWILEPGENPQSLQFTPYLTQQEIEQAVLSKNFVDQLYLIKWKSLSYNQSTWEPESFFKEIYEEKIQDYNKFNRSLDQSQREKLDSLIKNHKKMLRLTERKYQNKRIDANQEAFLALQESKINRQLLNQKIQEIMGNAFYQFVQYSQKDGFVPQFKKPTQILKDYQIIGLNWLIRAWHQHRNVVLADEMGLGKTIMTLSLFEHLNRVYKLKGPYLILAPLTTLEHWKRIADEWTTLNSVLYYDPNSAEGRSEIRYWEWYYTDITYKGQITQKSELFKFNIIITSFEVFMQDLNPIIQEIPFMYIVVDEAHRLKNKQAKTLKLLKDHPCKRILLLTGTPVQNNTKELWTLLNYIEPEKFNSLDEFLERYGNLESFDQIQQLHTMLKPHFLRRLKEEVDNSIPPLQETVIEVGLTTVQNTYYKGIYGENRMMLAKFGTNSIKTSQLNNIDVQLRKCCNHLFLLKGVEEELTKDCKNEEDLYKKLLESSGKLMLLDKFIEKFKKENHKMLIFSQFKRMLDIIELYLKMKAVPYEKLTGSVKTQDRISAIQRFNDDKTFGGGLGINLTSARVVIIFDSDWNPQNDLQAIARAHRIGQKFEVQVFRLITSKTYEEQMFERASKKLGMEQALFSKGAFHQNDDFELSSLHLRGLTELKQDSKEIENLLKYGAYAFIDDGEENDQVNFNKDIDEILATGKKKEFMYSKGIYTLQKSTFNAAKYENLPDVNDPEFWNKVMPYESIISISVLEKKFKKEKKEMGKSDKMQKEFFKDLEIVFNDFMDAKFDVKTSAATKKQFESDEEKLREILKKMIRLNGMKLIYVEKCKEWLRDMLRTNKRKKPQQTMFQNQNEGVAEQVHLGGDDEEEVDLHVEEDDIIIYDSDEQIKNRILRKRNPTAVQQCPKLEYEGEQVLKKRGRKPKNPILDALKHGATKSFDDSDNFEGEEEEDVYGDEEDKEYQLQDNKVPKKQYQDEDYGDSDEPGYGLRHQRKRQKTTRDEFNYGHSNQNALNYQKNLPKINEQIVKKNEKNGIVCSYCLHPETQENPCQYFCKGYCQRFFHEDCKDQLFSGNNDQRRGRSNNPSQWQCDDCLDNIAVCFCCKRKGPILLFPKKGKPKAAGFSDQQQSIQNIGQDDEIQDEDILSEQNDDLNKDSDDDLDDENEIENDDDVEAEVNDQEEIKNVGTDIPSQTNEVKIEELLQEQDEAPLEEIKVDEQDEKPADIIQIKPEQSTKIVLSNIGIINKKEYLDSNHEQKLKLKNGASSSEPETNDKRYVVRCTLGLCFKYYHVECVYKNKNVSCINSMKVQRFRCPLHYCEICQASGDSVLIVQCVTCPTAYHLKCLPQDIQAIRLTKKYIICGKHNMSPENFPKYEEKSGGYISQRGLQGSIVQGNSQKGDKKKKKRAKKRGRKPKNVSQQDDNEDDSEADFEGGEDYNEYPSEQQLRQQVQQRKDVPYQQFQQPRYIDDARQGGYNSNIQIYQQNSSSSSIKGEPQVQKSMKPLFTVEKGHHKSSSKLQQQSAHELND